MNDARAFNAQHSTSNVQRPKREGARFDLEERLLGYAARIMRLAEKLPNTRAGNHVAGQLLRCGTSPLPNHGEAQAAESRRDFVHKMRVCLKELRETRRWLRLIQRVPLIKSATELASLLSETEEVIRIFHKSIKTAERNAAGLRRQPSVPSALQDVPSAPLNVES